MSMNIYTIGELKEFIKNLPDEMLVVTKSTEKELWKTEGMFDVITPYITDKYYEVRNGLNPCEEKSNMGDILVLSDCDEEINNELFNDNN